MPKLLIKNLNKTFYNTLDENSFSLENINLCIENGSFLSILGPSGCGKTTLLNIVCGFIKPDSGSIVLDDEDITNLAVEKRRFSIVAQNPLLFPNMNALQNIEFGLKMQKTEKKQRREIALDMLDKVGLNGFGKRYYSQLSGGQSQRVAIARALVTNPKVLLMDEPFSALNEEIRENMIELISKIHKDMKTTVAFVTHNKEEANRLSDRIVTMNKGKIIDIK